MPSNFFKNVKPVELMNYFAVKNEKSDPKNFMFNSMKVKVKTVELHIRPLDGKAINK